MSISDGRQPVASRIASLGSSRPSRWTTLDSVSRAAESNERSRDSGCDCMPTPAMPGDAAPAAGGAGREHARGRAATGPRSRLAPGPRVRRSAAARIAGLKS